jgi:hypothetical protein
MLFHYLVVQQHYMGQQQAKTCNNITQNKTLFTSSPNENNLHTVSTRRPHVLNGRSEGSEHNSEISDATEFSGLLRPTLRKQSLFLNSVTQNGAIQAQTLSLLLIMGWD